MDVKTGVFPAQEIVGDIRGNDLFLLSPVVIKKVWQAAGHILSMEEDGQRIIATGQRWLDRFETKEKGGWTLGAQLVFACHWIGLIRDETTRLRLMEDRALPLHVKKACSRYKCALA